jgi:hypothetical protein
MLAARVIHLGSWRKSAGVATARATAWAPRVSRACRRARVPEPTVVYKPRQLALKVQGRDVVLTKVQNRLERDGVVTSTAGRRRRRSGSVGGAAAEGLQAPDQRNTILGKRGCSSGLEFGRRRGGGRWSTTAAADRPHLRQCRVKSGVEARARVCWRFAAA